MPTTVAGPIKFTIPPEVQAFAEERGLATYLPAIVDALHRVFAEATRIGAELHEDSEVSNLRWILFDVEVPGTARQLQAATEDWYRLTAQLCPARLLSEFGLHANRVEP